MKRDVFDIALELLDHEVVDAAGMPCGIVDDVELAGGPGQPLRAVALLIGPGTIAERLVYPFNVLVRRMFGSSHVRVPWSRIRTIDERITLRDSAQSHGLGALDRRCGRAIARIPGSSR
jgi:sporulation protein YlmC with PRC-barrel domain